MILTILYFGFQNPLKLIYSIHGLLRSLRSSYFFDSEMMTVMGHMITNIVFASDKKFFTPPKASK